MVDMKMFFIKVWLVLVLFVLVVFFVGVGVLGLYGNMCFNKVLKEIYLNQFVFMCVLGQVILRLVQVCMVLDCVVYEMDDVKIVDLVKVVCEQVKVSDDGWNVYNVLLFVMFEEEQIVGEVKCLCDVFFNEGLKLVLVVFDCYDYVVVCLLVFDKLYELFVFYVIKVDCLNVI